MGLDNVARRLVSLGFTLLAGSILPGAAGARPPEYVGGSNYAWYHLDGCHRDSFGVIGNYHQQKSTIHDQLRLMYANGQRRLRIPLFYRPQQGSSTAPLTRTSILSTQIRTNLTELVGTVRQIGFVEVIVGSFPLGYNDPTHWKEWHEDRYRANWSVIVELRQLMDASSLSYKLDLQNEGVPFPFQTVLAEYSRRIWQDYVKAYGPTNTVGVSAISTPGRLRQIPEIYGGIYPEAFDLHLYKDAGRNLEKADEIFRSSGIPAVPIIIGEALYNDPVEASELAQAARAIDRRVLFLTQWPVARDAFCRDVSTAPPSEFEAYHKAGF